MDTRRLTLEEVTDSALLAELQQVRAQYARNDAVFKAQAEDLFRHYRGKVIVIAGGELFAADGPDEARAWAATHHPDDKGLLIHYIPPEKAWRIYGNSRGVVSL